MLRKEILSCLLLQVIIFNYVICKHTQKTNKTTQDIGEKKQVVTDDYGIPIGNYPNTNQQTGYQASNYQNEMQSPQYGVPSQQYGAPSQQFGAPPQMPMPPLPMPPKPLAIPPTDDNVLDNIMIINDRAGLYGNNMDNMDPYAPSKPKIFEGDIVNTPHLSDVVDEMKDMSKKGIKAFDAINGGQWTSAIVPYTFSYSFSSAGRSVVSRAIAAFKKYTCIEFRPKRSSDRNYVEFMHGGGCSSMIGRQGGRQQVSLASGCLVTGIAIHEMMHALGFFHEQSRRDRDNYITINWSNINRPMWYNFQKYREGHASTLGEPYDKKSVMHYGNYAFSTNGRRAITSKSNYNEVLGQRSGMSKVDIDQLNKYYKCSGIVPTPSPGGGGNTKDKYGFCVVLGSYCTKDKWVSTNCERTCCKDTNKFCKHWLQGGYCKGKGYDDYMKKTCPESCGFC